ncbi:hypothetical protein SISSUDRAFT_1016849 [Sistotremastrum suecicum HHB10207 ss-3]|uniref:PH domain-containing protein n=1 Tax=Sistotremastrum suecicum HHB10207 ss-3 TaxID=1314776 RepID=A0A166GSY1_9AGAM|nr:hypothetical protein SISSUDRAFT_1016849 [Sistotremastrum suecicum HHB10207 ss-3]
MLSTSSSSASDETVMASSATTPLRIAKRDQPLARRQSSSYNHVRNNNLVSNSPFKLKASKIPTPRKVSADRENERPDLLLGFKRKQSRAFQVLESEKVVTKSPFLGKRPAPSPSPKASPKSSLVSKRLHGPRSQSGSPGSLGRRQRRKTVVFDELIDVVEFETEEPESEQSSYSQDSGQIHGGAHQMEREPEPEDPNALIDSILKDAQLNADDSLISIQSSLLTPPTSPQYESTENGVPYGRTHHAERRQAQRSTSSPMHPDEPDDEESWLPEDEDDIPYGRSHHVEREHAFHHEQAVLEAQAEALPGSPTPARPLRDSVYANGPVPRLDLGNPADVSLLDDDPFLPSTASSPPPPTRLDFHLPPPSPLEQEPTPDTSSNDDDSTSLPEDNMSFEQSFVSIVTEDMQLHSGVSVKMESSQPIKLPAPPVDLEPGIFGNLDLKPMPHSETPKEPPPPSPRPSVPEPAVTFDFGQPGVEIGEMKSALDRLVLGAERMSLEVMEEDSDASTVSEPSVKDEGMIIQRWDDSMATETEEDGGGPMVFPTPPPRIHTPRASASPSPLPPPIPPKDVPATPPRPQSFVSPSTPVVDSPRSAIAAREAAIQAKRREQREAELALEEERRREIQEQEKERQRKWEIERTTPKSTPKSTPQKPEGRKTTRRSLSTGDAQDVQLAVQRRVSEMRDAKDALGNAVVDDVDEGELAREIAEEMKKREAAPKDRNYRLREAGEVIYASSDKVSHLGAAGDVDQGRAWRTVRRPSDMNEYSRQMKEWRASEKPGKAHGKIFIRVVDVRGLDVPFPNSPTYVNLYLNNGIHFVQTTDRKLERDMKIEQEFELIERPNLEFSLTLKVRRDAHVVAQIKAAAAPPPRMETPPRPHTAAAVHPSTRSGMRGFFSSSPKKFKASPPPPEPIHRAQPVRPPPITLGTYLEPSDGSLVRVNIPFDSVMEHCDAKLLTTSIPLMGKRVDEKNMRKLGEMNLQMIRIPPLPLIPASALPQSLEETHKGLEYVKWHHEVYFEGTLTQNGGDCNTWKRRRFRLEGAKLIAFNDVTKKIVCNIDLKEAISIEDDQEFSSQNSGMSASRSDEFESLYGVERSFKLLFRKDEEISFFADNDQEKAQWLLVLRQIVGKIPPNPVWAELMRQRQQELHKAPRAPPKNRS